MKERRAGKAEKQANQAYENKQKPGKFEGIGIIKRESGTKNVVEREANTGVQRTRERERRVRGGVGL